MIDNECKFCSEHEAGDTLYECNGWDGGVSYDYIRDIKYCPLCGRKLGGVESLPSENQNGDAIYRQAAIDCITYDEEYTVECLKTLPPVTPQPKWIPVSERLPEKSGRYLAHIVNKHDVKLQYIMTCEYSADGYWNWFPDDECASDNVIAWMPLPQPYKGESEVSE